MSKSNHKTGSARAKLRFWGWGYADEQLADDELQMIDLMLKELMPGGSVEVDEPPLDDFELPRPRVEVPQDFLIFTSISKYDRLVHSYGKSYADLVRMLLRRVDNPPDWVCFPRDESDIERILAHATENNIAVIPFGGGTSVCGAVEPAVGNSFGATISLDLEHFNRVLEIDQTSRAARVQAGILGPDLEAALRPHGLTLRHFPQSFKFSTLGGWIATRAGGHFATLYTHVDDFVESTRMITPRGIMHTRRLPGSGAGPSPDRMVLGSEGILGVITEAWVKLQQVPRWRASTSLRYANFSHGADAVRRIAQAGLYPSNCRLLDQTEAHWSGLDGRRGALLVIGFESADHPQTASMDRALAVLQSNATESADIVYSDTQQDAPVATDGAVAQWRNAFLRMPYYRNRLVACGLIADTFETAITWDRWEVMYRTVVSGMQAAMVEISGQPGRISCRFTHVYPDGPALYFSFFAIGSRRGDLQAALQMWRELKMRANQLVISLGGTITHHHAVGRDHRSGYHAQSPDLYRGMLAAAKVEVDPQGVLNPGVLIDPIGRNVGPSGVLGDS